MSDTTTSYQVAVGNLWVAIDFEALAVSVTAVGSEIDKTEDLGDGFLIDRAEDGRVVAVEILAARGVGDE